MRPQQNVSKAREHSGGVDLRAIHKQLKKWSDFQFSFVRSVMATYTFGTSVKNQRDQERNKRVRSLQNGFALANCKEDRL